MRRTLRSGNPSERPQHPSSLRGPRPSESPGASTAASLAWETTESRTSSSAYSRAESSILPSFLRPRKPAAAPRQPSSNSSSRPASARQAEANAEAPSLSRKAQVKDSRGESSPVPASAATRTPNPAAPLKPPPGTNHTGTRSVSPASSSSKFPSDTESAGVTRNARGPTTKRGRRYIPEEKLQRSPAVPSRAGTSSQTGPGLGHQCHEEPASLVETESTLTSGTCTRNDDTSSPKRGPLESPIIGNLPDGIDETAARQILGELTQGDQVHWEDIAGLDAAKNSLREAVVYPFLRPDLFIGLRQPACGILLFGPPGTGKTMLARAVATESKSTFFSLSASSLTSKYLGDSEKLVRALFTIARMMAPSIIFVDEIDSLLGQRSGTADHETTRRIKTEFLIQWSNLQRAVPLSDDGHGTGDANRVLVLAATNLPWAIDEAARRRFVKRQYIPLPEPDTRGAQLRRLLSRQNHTLTAHDIGRLVTLTEGKDIAPVRPGFHEQAADSCRVLRV